MRMKKINLLFSIVCLSLVNYGYSQLDTIKNEDGKLTINGYIDSYYFTNFNNPLSQDNMGNSGYGRGFDRKVDQFNLGMVQTVFKYTNKKSEMVADLVYGPTGQYANYGNLPNSASPTYGYKIGFDVLSGLMIKQAFFKYNATDKLSFSAGQFSTHIGYEYIESTLNFHYSINHTFNEGIPFYHTGIKANYQFNDKFSAMLGIVNGFDHLDDNNRAKGIIGQLAYTPRTGYALYANYITTNEATPNAKTGYLSKANFSVYDLNGSFQLTDKFTLGFWTMLGTEKGNMNASSPGMVALIDSTDTLKTKFWSGYNIYTAWKFNDRYSLGLRSEYFNNKQGVRALRNMDAVSGKQIGADVITFTLTGHITLADGHIILKPELRYDQWSKVKGVGNEKSQQFMDSKGVYTKNTQTTFGMAMIYKW
jgi:hypothetical protein